MSAARCTEGKNHRQDALEEASLRHLGQYSDPDVVRQLLEAQGQECDHQAEQELARATKRLGELEQAFLNDLDRVDRGVLTEPEYLKRQEVRRREQEGLQTLKAELEATVAAQKEVEAVVTTGTTKGHACRDRRQQREESDAKAVLLALLKAAHGFNEGRV